MLKFLTLVLEIRLHLLDKVLEYTTVGKIDLFKTETRVQLAYFHIISQPISSIPIQNLIKPGSLHLPADKTRGADTLSCRGSNRGVAQLLPVPGSAGSVAGSGLPAARVVRAAEGQPRRVVLLPPRCRGVPAPPRCYIRRQSL